MKKSRLLGAVCASIIFFISMSSNAALLSRLGGAAAWDDVLDITWLTDADLSGAGTWDNQLSWIDSLNAGAGHLGYTDWRLASMSVAAGLPTGTTTSVFPCSTSPSTTEPACRDNELGYMFYHNMDGAPFNDKRGDQMVDGVLLTDVQDYYWSGTEFDSNSAYYFDFGGGGQANNSKLTPNYGGWAVRTGDSVVPVPAAVWLFGSGLIGLIGVARCKHAA